MKKIIIWILIIAAAILCVYGFLKDDSTPDEDLTEITDRLDANEDILPLYKTLNDEEKELYAKICYAIENFQDKNIVIGKFDSLGEVDSAKDEFRTFFTMLIFEQPQYFWANPYDYEVVTTGKSDSELTLSFRINYLMDKDEAMEKQEELTEKVNYIVKKANKKDEVFEKILFVYDYIMDNTTYDKGLADSDDSEDIGRTAYGCLIDGKTVCTGYALAFNMIMQEFDILCGVEFSSYGELSVNNHVWNYCKLDGDYYYFDLTWDDTGFDGKEYRGVIDYSHLYFGLTKNELRESRYTFSEEATTPECNGKEYNYYVYKGFNVEEYDLDEVEKIIRKQSGNDYIEIRFDNTADRISAEIDLIEEGKIHDILNTDSTISYVVSKSGHHLLFFKK